MPFDGHLIAPTKWGAPRVSKAAIEKYGLIAVVACNEMAGGVTRELLTGAVLTAASGADWAAEGAFGPRVNAAGEGYFVTCPPALRRPWPMSIFARVAFLGAPTGYAQIAGISREATEVSPSQSFSINRHDAQNAYGIWCNDGAGNLLVYRTATNNPFPTSGVHDYVGIAIGGTGGMLLFQDGVSVGSVLDGGSSIGSGPAYASDAVLSVGNYDASLTYNPNCIVDLVLIGAMGWTADHVAALHADPYQVFADPLANLRLIYGTAASSSPSGLAALTLANTIISGIGVMQPSGSAAIVLANATLAASGVQTITGAAALALANAVVDATGSFGDSPAGAAALTLPQAALAAMGAEEIIGAAALALSAVSLAASGRMEPAGDAALALGRAVLAASGTSSQTASGSAALTLAAMFIQGAARQRGVGRPLVRHLLRQVNRFHILH